MNLRSFRPHFALARLRQNSFIKKFPTTPWLTETSIRILDSWLKPSDCVIEWGSGRDTLWIASRVASVLSIEENAQWYAIVAGMLKNCPLTCKVDYRLIPSSGGDFAEPEVSDYVNAAESLADATVDLALVDGSARCSCMRTAMRKLKPGGLLALDNANRFLPNPCLGIPSTLHEPRTQYKTPNWERLAIDLKSWRHILTTDQIWNTFFWVKPPN